MASNLERLARDKGLKGDLFKSVRATLMAQAAQIRALDGPEDVLTAPTVTPQPSETPVIAERIALRDKFTDEERKAIEDAHGVIYTPTGLSLDAQRSARAAKNKPSFPNDFSWGGERLTARPSRQVEMAIFPDPKEFFAPGSFGRDTKTQEGILAEDAKRLGLPNITQILPDEASTFADIVFQHEDATGKWLFGPEYAKAQNLDWVYGRTNNPTNQFGSGVAFVGGAGSDSGVRVSYWLRDFGNGRIGAVRLVVPVETK